MRWKARRRLPRHTSERFDGHAASLSGCEPPWRLRRWVVERSFAWATRFRRLVEDDEHDLSPLADLHIVVFVCIMLKQAAQLAASS